MAVLMVQFCALDAIAKASMTSGKYPHLISKIGLCGSGILPRWSWLEATPTKKPAWRWS